MSSTSVLALTAVLFLGTACSAFDETATDAGNSSGSMQVAAAFYPLEYVAERVAGDRAEVIGLTTPGNEPHDLELTIRETAEIADSDLVVYESGFQAAIDAAVEQNATGALVDAAEVVGLQPLAEGESDDEGDLDPHFWLDPTRMATLGDAVADELSDLDPANAEEYATNAAALRTDLESLDADFSTGLADCERSTIVVSHDAFGYLSRYGIEIAAIAGLSPEAEPTPADLADLQQLISDAGITTVFSERLVSPRLTETLADDMGVQTAVLDPIEGLSDETAGEDYLSLMKQNLAALQQANACT